MWQSIRALIHSNRQTKYLILMVAIYTIALAWTTVQAYARLAYSRSDLQEPIIITIPTPDQK